MDANDAASYVQEMAGENANIIFGAMYDDTYADEASITVIATGLTEQEEKTAAPKKAGATRRIVPDFNYQAGASKPEMSSGLRTPTPLAGLNTGSDTSIGKLKTPEGKVQERDIQIPDFLKRR